MLPMSARHLPAAIERFLFSPFSLLLVIAIAFVLNAGSLPLTDVDEGAFSEATREMMARGNLVSPTLNDAPRHDKPILSYWARAESGVWWGYGSGVCLADTARAWWPCG